MRLVRSLASTLVLAAAACWMGGCPMRDSGLTDAAAQTAVDGALSAGKALPESPEPVPLAPVDSSGTSLDGAAAPQTPDGELLHAANLSAAYDCTLIEQKQLAGNWLLTSDRLIPNLDSALSVTAITLRADGHARVYFSDAATAGRDVVRAFALFDGETLALDLSAEPLLVSHPERTMLFPVVVVQDTLLGVADENGQIALFARQGQLPADVLTRPLAVLESFAGLPPPHSFSDLTLHFGDLIYNSPFPADQIERFDLDTHTIGAPVGPGQNRFVMGKQGLDFWTHCGCGGSPEITRRSLTSVFDTVHTGNDLNRQITIRAAEYLPSTDRLWLHGRGSSDPRFKFLIVNTNGEPDTLVHEIDFNRDARGLSFDGTNLWAVVTIASQVICRIDAATGRVVESFDPPAEDVNWIGLEPVGADVYLIGIDPSGQGVMIRATLP